MSQGFRGAGRYHTDDQNKANLGYGYAGQVDDALGVGFGVYNHPNLQVLGANAKLGGWNTEAGYQIGGEASAQSIGIGGTLGDIASLFGADVTNEKQGGWENFFSIEGHGPKADAQANVGTDGLFVGAGAELVGASAKLGGAEYDWFGGTEITAGVGAGGVGASGGIHWSDDDKDGVRELGLSLGGEWGVGVDLGLKTELFGHAANGIASAWDWLTGGE